GVCSADHHCCGSACTAPCQSCAIPGAVGRCLPVPAGTDPDGECGIGATCNAAGACAAMQIDAGMPAPRRAGDMGRTGSDMGSPGGDGSMVSADSGTHDAGTTGRSKGGCCGVAGAGGDEAPLAVLAGIAALVLTRRRRRAC